MNIKETSFKIRRRCYNGAIGLGSVFKREYVFIIEQSLDDTNQENGLIKYSKYIDFCCDEKLGSSNLAKINVEIPYLVDSDKINKFNELITKIRSDGNYKYNETHYSKDRFDLKRLHYMDIIIDGEEYETDDESILDIINDIVDFQKYDELLDNYYQNIYDYMKKSIAVSQEERLKILREGERKHREKWKTLSRSEFREIFNQVECCVNRNYSEEENISSIKNFIFEFATKLNYLETKSDSRFVPYGRMLFLREEFTNNLNNKQYLDALYNLGDYLTDSRIQTEYGNNSLEIVNNNKEYFDEDVICTEEKQILLDMVKEFDNKLNNKFQNFSVNSIPDNLKDFISFDDDGYVLAKQKLPVELESNYNSFIENYYSNDNKIVNNIVNKIIELPYNTETTIAQLINYKPEVAFVSPMTQGIISNAVRKKCRSNNIELEEANDSFDGLAYYIKFKKNNSKTTKIESEKINSLTQEEFQKLFEQDENKKFIRLIIPAHFVSSIIPSVNSDMNLIGKGNLDLTPEEVSLLKIYARELQAKINDYSKHQYVYSDKEYRELFEQDENKAFVRLIIPKDDYTGEAELNLIGKLPQDYSLDEIIRMKTYSSNIYDHIIDPNDIDSTVEVLVNVIDELSKGTEISISQILGNHLEDYETKELFKINQDVINVCREKGINLNFDKYKDRVVGLPYSIPFIKE